MWFSFIFESIGTSELLLIGLVALIVFGPRKIPQLAKTLGKTMADFRRMTGEFRETWEKEVDLEGFKEGFTGENLWGSENSIKKEISSNEISENNQGPLLPAIREVKNTSFIEEKTKENSDVREKEAEIISSKKDWL